MSDFAAVIVTHGRPDRVYTYRTLRSYGYTGRVILLLDDEDSTRKEYDARYPGEVEVFSKKDAASLFDIGDNFPGRRGVVYARNAVFGVMEKLGISNFVVLDDDYTYFSYRFDSAARYSQKMCHRLDEVFPLFSSFLRLSSFVTIAMGQGGDYIAGAASCEKIKASRKAMNVFFCASDRPFRFDGRINEDVTAYTDQQRKGAAMLTVLGISVYQGMTQKNSGGLTELYLDAGTYVKSFYSVMFAPSCVRVSTIAGYKNDASHMRIHHRVNWNAAAPQIIREEHRKHRSAQEPTHGD
jgi:hypothetical protein